MSEETYSQYLERKNEENKYLTPKAPLACLSCNAAFIGGHVPAGEHMKLGLRVFYDCGASLSIKEDTIDGCYLLLFKNCHCPSNQQVEQNNDCSANYE